MGTIHKLTKGGDTIFPATVTDAVVHPQVAAPLTNMINEYNVSVLFPTSGVSGTDKYTLSGAVSQLNSTLTNDEKVVGVKVTFYTNTNPSELETYTFTGSTFSSTDSWTKNGIYTDNAPTQGSDNMLTSGTIYNTVSPGAFLDDDSGSGNLPADFDAYTDTVHNIAQTLSSTQKSQVLQNLGLGTSLDNVPTASSDNLVKSGGVLDYVSTNGSAYDISAANSSATYANLAAALGTGGANVPTEVRKGGMSVKFVSSSDNKYVQARCMVQNFTTDVTQWQGVDDVPTAGSHNLVESGAVEKSIRDIVGNVVADKSVNVSGTNYADTGIDLESGVNYVIYAQCSTAVTGQNSGLWLVVDSSYTLIKKLSAEEFVNGYEVAYTPSVTGRLKVRPGATGTIVVKVWNTAIPATIKQMNDKLSQVDNTPLLGSDKYVKSGGVAAGLRTITQEFGYYEKYNAGISGILLSTTGTTSSNASYATSDFIDVEKVKRIKFAGLQTSNAYGRLCLYDQDKHTPCIINITRSLGIINLSDYPTAKYIRYCHNVANIPLVELINDSEVLTTEEKVKQLNVVKGKNILDISRAVTSSLGTAYREILLTEVEGGQAYKFYGVYQVVEYSEDLSVIETHTSNNAKYPYYTLNENTKYISVAYNATNFPRPTAIKGIFVGLADDYGYHEAYPETPEFIRDSNNIVGDNQSMFACGYRLNSSGGLTYYDSIAARAWDYIAVEPETTYRLAFDNGNNNARQIAYYNESKEFIRLDEPKSSVYTFTTPANAYFIRVAASNSANALYICEFTEFEVPQTYKRYKLEPAIRLEPDVIISPLNGKIWNVMGDSISDNGTGAVEADKYYSIIKRKTGCNTRNYGVGSTALTGTAEGAMCNRYVNMDDNADYITVFGGTNDFGQQRPLGQWGDSTNATFYGGMKIICEGLINKYIGKKIGFILPIPRYKGSPTPSDYSYPNPGLTEYVEAMKDVLKRYSIPYLDLYTESNLAPKFEAVRTSMMPDGLHPNALGHQVIAEKILAFLERL